MKPLNEGDPEWFLDFAWENSLFFSFRFVFPSVAPGSNLLGRWFSCGTSIAKISCLPTPFPRLLSLVPYYSWWLLRSNQLTLPNRNEDFILRVRPDIARKLSSLEFENQELRRKLRDLNEIVMKPVGRSRRKLNTVRNRKRKEFRFHPVGNLLQFQNVKSSVFVSLPYESGVPLERERISLMHPY